jgi:hypothetical protein
MNWTKFNWPSREYYLRGIVCNGFNIPLNQPLTSFNTLGDVKLVFSSRGNSLSYPILGEKTIAIHGDCYESSEVWTDHFAFYACYIGATGYNINQSFFRFDQQNLYVLERIILLRWFNENAIRLNQPGGPDSAEFEGEMVDYGLLLHFNEGRKGLIVVDPPVRDC